MGNAGAEGEKMAAKVRKINDLGIIIAAGGSSKRFSSGDSANSKLLVSSGILNKETSLDVSEELPLFMYSVLNFIDLCTEENFIIVVRDSDYEKFADYLKNYIPHKNPKLIKGGETRMHSVFNGLNELTESAKFAAVHDAARPFAGKEILLGCLKAARKHNGAVTAKKMTDTVKMADENGFIRKTVDRSFLWRVETPQIFPTELLKKAYMKAIEDNLKATDDAGIMEHSGYSPFLYEHRTNNRKITFPEDIK
jgi:2-C-methyl-D-erythritol 4-phosphate cytidylyltransferase